MGVLITNGKKSRIVASVSARERVVTRCKQVDTTDNETSWSHDRTSSDKHGISGFGLEATTGGSSSVATSGRTRRMRHREREHEYAWSPYKLPGGVPINPGQVAAFDVPNHTPIHYINILNADRTALVWDNYNTIECRVTIEEDDAPRFQRSSKMSIADAKKLGGRGVSHYQIHPCECKWRKSDGKAFCGLDGIARNTTVPTVDEYEDSCKLLPMFRGGTCPKTGCGDGGTKGGRCSNILPDGSYHCLHRWCHGSHCVETTHYCTVYFDVGAI